jgi:hypothetical protein
VTVLSGVRRVNRSSLVTSRRHRPTNGWPMRVSMRSSLLGSLDIVDDELSAPTRPTRRAGDGPARGLCATSGRVRQFRGRERGAAAAREVWRPVGRLEDGAPIYAPIGEILQDGDRIRCHLCRRWLRMVAGPRLIAAHGMTTDEYRELFHLDVTMSTACAQTGELKRFGARADRPSRSGTRLPARAARPTANCSAVAVADGSPPRSDIRLGTGAEDNPGPLHDRRALPRQGHVAMSDVRAPLAAVARGPQPRGWLASVRQTAHHPSDDPVQPATTAAGTVTPRASA